MSPALTKLLVHPESIRTDGALGVAKNLPLCFGLVVSFICSIKVSNGQHHMSSLRSLILYEGRSFRPLDEMFLAFRNLGKAAIP